MTYPLRTVLGCDVRSLAIFRVAISGLILFDVGDWFLHAEQLFSTDGFLDALESRQLSPYPFSLTYLTDSLWYTKLLLLILAASTISLGLGWYTKPATVLCWLLLVSFHIRNPLVLISGDSLLRMMLLWSIFTPLERTWSLDAVRNRSKRASDADASASEKWVFTAGTACLIMQLCMMYWSAGLAKLNDTWLNGSALDYVLRSDVYSRPFGRWLIEYPAITNTLSQATPWIEIAGPFLLFVPIANSHFRFATIALLVSFHMGIEASLSVAKFGVVSAIAWLPLLPSTLWNISLVGATNSLQTTRVRPLDTCTPPHRLHPTARILLSHILPLLLLIYVAIWNIAALIDLSRATTNRCMPIAFYNVGEATMLKQKFHMFYEPPTHNPRFIFHATLKDGSLVELRTGRTLDPLSSNHFPELPMDWTWKKVHRYLLSNGPNQVVFQSVLDHYTQRWNREHQGQRAVLSSKLGCTLTPINRRPSQAKPTFIPSLAEWNEPVTPTNRSNKSMLEQFDKTLDQLENGYLFPEDED